MRERTHESGEMYLKVIERLTRGKSTVQPIEIAEELGYVKSSVSRAIKLLRGKGLITVNETNGVSLTPSGRRRAEQLRHKYEVLRAFFVSIGAEESAAEKAACKIEHCVTDEICGLIALHIPGFRERKEKPVPNTNESVEMYLETILRLEESGQEPDLTNIARVMNVTKPAIIKARQKLCDLGFVRHDTHNIYLTPLGREIAERVYEKHKLFTRLLRRMGVSRERAEEDACRIEHIVSDETVEAVRRYQNGKEEQANAHGDGSEEKEAFAGTVLRELSGMRHDADQSEERRRRGDKVSGLQAADGGGDQERTNSGGTAGDRKSESGREHRGIDGDT